MLQIDVEACHKGDARSLNVAAKILNDSFGGDAEKFRVYFGLRKTSPALARITETYTRTKG